MNSTTSEHRGRLRARAAVVADFDVSDLVTADDDVDEVFDFLDEDCDQLETSDGTLRWAVKDVRRQETLASVPLAELRRLREQATISEVTQVQEMLDRSLRSGWTDEEVDTLPLADARAASVVAQWWDGARDDVPTARRIRDQIDRLALFGDVRAMADNHFVGRAAESARLRRSFERDTAPVLLHGPGGMGKSALVARHIVWALDEAGAKVALLDFDDPTLDPFNPAKLAERVIDVVTRQLDATDRNVVELRAQAADAAMSANYASASQGRRGATIGADWEYLIKDLLSVVGHDVPILVVLDTFEQVQRQGPSAVYAVAQLVDGLRRLPRMRIVCPAGEIRQSRYPGRRCSWAVSQKTKHSTF